MLDESLEHLFVTCHFTTLLWKELIAWCNGRQIKVESLSAVNIIFGDWQKKDYFFLLNNIILIAKQYICSCRSNNLKPLSHVLLQRIKFDLFALLLNSIKGTNYSKLVPLIGQLQWMHFNSTHHSLPVGVIRINGLIGMCSWMGSHFHDWIE